MFASCALNANKHRLSAMTEAFTPDLVLWAYENGYFPMADEECGSLYWHAPDPRAIVPLDNVKVSRSLRRSINKDIFLIRFDTAFEQVMRGCAERESTWISEDIIDVYTALHRVGFAHSVESWHEGRLVGGLYGIALGGAFFGESMFSRMTDASKVAFVFLAERMKDRGFSLLDSQYINPHMASLGAVEIPRRRFMRLLAKALEQEVSFI